MHIHSVERKGDGEAVWHHCGRKNIFMQIETPMQQLNQLSASFVSPEKHTVYLPRAPILKIGMSPRNAKRAETLTVLRTV